MPIEFVDPIDGKTINTARGLVKKYSRDLGVEVAGALLDYLASYVDKNTEPGGAPDDSIEVTGTAGADRISHRLGAVPRSYHILGFTRVDTVEVQGMDATSITVKIEPAGGKVRFALYK
jgi:hypothetical protein